MPDRMTRSIERRADGWYDVHAERDVDMLHDIYRAGGFVDWMREVRRNLQDLQRRGA